MGVNAKDRSYWVWQGFREKYLYSIPGNQFSGYQHDCFGVKHWFHYYPKACPFILDIARRALELS
jgi:hypothetical protein